MRKFKPVSRGKCSAKEENSKKVKDENEIQ
jgi:hypothetical protein